MGVNKIEVKMLGGFSVSCRGVVADWQSSRSRKAKNLLAYLLYHHRHMIPVEELINVLGGENKNAAPIAAFRTMLYRVRRTTESIQAVIGKPLIITQGGKCGWNPELAVEIDVECFEAMCRDTSRDGPAALEWHRRTLALYQGGFLRELDCEQWVQPLEEYYRSLYLEEVTAAAPLLLEAGDVSTVESICCDALRRSPYHEPLCRWLMRARAARSDMKGAAEAYDSFRARLYEDLGVMPEEETQRVYWDVMRNEERELTPESIHDQLRENTPASGAFICDFEMFKLFYQAEVRAAARRGDAIHIGILTAAGSRKPLSERGLERAMGQLQVLIQKNLRSGDIAARCSSSQYILMLVQANYENSNMVCSRVIQAFNRTHPRSPARLRSVVFPLELAFGKDEREE